MVFNLKTRELYTDDGTFIKRVHCGKRFTWEAFKNDDNVSVRFCSVCEKNVIDVEDFDDTQVLALVESNPSACIRIGPKQKTIKLQINYEH